MNIKLAKENVKDAAEMRAAYCKALCGAAKSDGRIVSINCDLQGSMGLNPFMKEFPGRAFNVGIMEANGIGIAAGMSAAGFVPFFNTFATFATRRVYDQAFISCAYAGLGVKIVGGDGGVAAAYNGGTHMSFEDVGMMRLIPGITIIEPSDAVMMAGIVPKMAAESGVFYMRFPRKSARKIYEPGSEFEFGKAALLREGTDVSIIASGMLVSESLDAARILAEKGISARVADMFTIKPIDKECVVECAKRTGAVVTAENHSIYNGLGSAVAEVLAENSPVPMRRVGVMDEFGEVGQQDYLMERFALTAKHIAEKAEEAILAKK